jgi:DNA-binding response OmpR family regulator
MVSENDAEKEILQVSMGTRKYRVMIVDDELDITAIFKLGLEQDEFIVSTFNNPNEALSKFRPGLYDLMILDIRMPGMNGFQLCQENRNLDNKVKVCFLTAFEDYREEFKALFPSLNEVKCYLKKPITIQELTRRLQDVAKS